MPASTPPELMDAVRAFSRVARALADYLEAVAEVERSYGVSVEELLRTVFSDSSKLQDLPITMLAELYSVALELREAAQRVSSMEELSAEEKMELAARLRRIASRLEELVG